MIKREKRIRKVKIKRPHKERFVKLRAFYNKGLRNKMIVLFVLAAIDMLVIETLARHSLIAGLKFMATSPLVFLFNTLIIFATYSVGLLIRRQVFWIAVISFIWIMLGVANGIILLNRMTPLTVADFSVMNDGLTLVTNYLSKGLIALIAGAVIIVLAVFVFLFIKGPKTEKVVYKKAVAAVLCVALVLAGAYQIGTRTGVMGTYFVNLAYAYRDYGVPYCFLSSWLDKGIDKPHGYSEESIKGLFDKGELSEDGTYKPEKKAEATDKPNIIFLQLESFMDPTVVEGFEYSQDPIPNFRKLMKEYSSGLYVAPAVGAGTANTEFENITGISVKFFGPGEYPYKEILQEETCESMAYDLREIGYSSHVIHNHRGSFYGRNTAFKNLGFDTFTSLEYMTNAPMTPKNWAKDSILTGQVIEALKSTENRDYIYTISVQGHGKYPTEQLISEPDVVVTKAPSAEEKWQFEYYVNQLYEMDKFVKNITDTLAKFDEDCILIMYGDHIPALNITEENLKAGRTLFNTDYIIWDNFGLEKKDGTLKAYEAGAEIQKRVGLKEGLMTIYQQDHEGDKGYKKGLRALAYDMLYGKKYIYGEKNPFEPTKLKMGIKDIKIDKIIEMNGKYYIKGKNFTEYSKISLDDEILETTYLGPTLLELKDKVDKDAIERMKVSQVEKYSEILSTTE
ncbi:MAG: LTA synthase family protein [Firmicutes bacterium]|nr:LTA synthase family protein [Bacillota bacterium]